ncbi:hypothetical protein TH67_08525 [Campylobacter concisus]|nr:hypothetical protein TH67_08525 [Campylobacter concisus]
MAYTSFYLVALNLSTKTAQPQCSRPIKASILCLFEVVKIVSVAYKFSSVFKTKNLKMSHLVLVLNLREIVC